MQYADELKMDAILMMQQGTKIAEVSQLLNVPASTLYRWRKEANPKPEQVGEAALLQEQLQELVALEGQIKEALLWVQRKMQAEAKEREQRAYELDEQKSRLVFGKQR